MTPDAPYEIATSHRRLLFASGLPQEAARDEPLHRRREEVRRTGLSASVCSVSSVVALRIRSGRYGSFSLIRKKRPGGVAGEFVQAVAAIHHCDVGGTANQAVSTSPVLASTV